VLEELQEIDGALGHGADDAPAAAAGSSGASQKALADELGDLLFTVVNWSRHLHIDAETALRAANDKFERRFARMELLARERGLELTQLAAAEWEALWNAAKLNAS
jgi:ATP diphosphatase